MSQTFLDLQELRILYFCPSRRSFPSPQILSSSIFHCFCYLLKRNKPTDIVHCFMQIGSSCPLLPKTFSCVLTHHTIFRKQKKKLKHADISMCRERSFPSQHPKAEDCTAPLISPRENRTQTKKFSAVLGNKTHTFPSAEGCSLVDYLPMLIGKSGQPNHLMRKKKNYLGGPVGICTVTILKC